MTQIQHSTEISSLDEEILQMGDFGLDAGVLFRAPEIVDVASLHQSLGERGLGVLSLKSWGYPDEIRVKPPTHEDLKLTERQYEVIKASMQGMNTSEVATELFISPKTVKNHKSAAYLAFGVSNITEAIIHALQNGVPIPTEPISYNQ